MWGLKGQGGVLVFAGEEAGFLFVGWGYLFFPSPLRNRHLESPQIV